MFLHFHCQSPSPADSAVCWPSAAPERDTGIYIVTSSCSTLPGHLIRARARMKFWNRYSGDRYSHVSIALDIRLTDMFSFARKELHNPLDSGLIRENIRTGVFAFHPNSDWIAVFRLPVDPEQYRDICRMVDRYWARRDQLHYNFRGLFSMLLVGRGVYQKDHYLCSQWVAELLAQSGIRLFEGKRPQDVRPFDFYSVLDRFKLFEGPLQEYPLY